MQIGYDNKIRKYFENYNNMIKKVNVNFAKALKKHINRLEASDNVYEFILLGLGNPHSLQGNLGEYYAVSISKNYRLILKPIVENFE